MPLDWMDVSRLSFLNLLLLERVQLSWFPGWLPEEPLAVALKANPAVEWYLRHQCPALNDWLDRVLASAPAGSDSAGVRQAELAVLSSITDLLVYALDPACYDAQPFLDWDNQELLDVADFRGKRVVDVGAGTGRLALAVAGLAASVFAVEPVGNLRAYLKHKARERGLRNVFVLDGLITDLPFPDQFADIVMGGHVFGDAPEAEYAELRRVTRPGGSIILCPGNPDQDNPVHAFLLGHGFSWSRFEEPRDGWCRKYWKHLAQGTSGEDH